jgi:hypothetical protein
LQLVFPTIERFFACPLFERTCGRSSHAGVGLDVILDIRHSGDLRTIADFDVADDGLMRAHDGEVANLRRSRNAALG